MSQAASSARRPLLKAAEVCEILKVQPYVLRSWEKEFPNLGVTRSPDGARLYRRADLDEVLRIKQLVFGEGLTIAGARRKLEEERATTEELPFEEVEDAAPPARVPRQARARIERVRKGLRSILDLLDRSPAPNGTASNGHGRTRAPVAVKAGSSPGTRRVEPKRRGVRT